MLSIRTLHKNDDFTDLIALSRAFFREYEAHHADFFKIGNLTDDDVVNYFLSFCGRDTRKAFIAVDNAHIVGYITAYVQDQPGYWQVKKVGEISGLMVGPNYRRQGIAAKLLAQAEAFFAAQGVKYFTVYTAVANQPGIDFYRKNGLRPIYTTLIGATQETWERGSQTRNR